MKSAIGKLLGAVAYAAFLLLFAELALQAFYYATAGDFLFRRVGLPIYASNEYSGVFNRPNLALEHHTQEFDTWYYNSAAGLRVPRSGAEYARDKSADTYRIMLLGPSFAYGWAVGYEETFGAVLERQLNDAHFQAPNHVEVINAGVPSLNPAPALRWYEHVGKTYSPDLVIQFVYGTMAVPNDPPVYGMVDEEGYLTTPGATLADRARQQLKKLATVFYAWVVWTRFHAAESEGGDRVLGAGREMKAATRFDLANPDVAEALEFYRDLERTVRSDGTELLVVYFPLSWAVHPEDAARWRHLGVSDIAGQVAFDTAFVQHLASSGMPIMDATADLQRAAQMGERLYYWLDIHWTPAGNAVTANAVGTHLLTPELSLSRARP